MTQPEFLGWVEFFRLYPFDHQSLHHRPAALVASAVGGAELADLLAWLNRDLAPKKPAEFSAADLATMKALGMKPPEREK